ncbi:Lrp/AsnC ligand binding domain-containing protein [Sessilibacter corallicola]|uniref:Leucine-responsive regulatory protein n=1 Tax=Sessilibacter corallicola TaxID=2904075 RepID=A0ABQ0AE87_9GAMM|nr:Lrp/AsnC ligand binding domain-containing protein [Sessilibacter corallicola]MCE2028334.1 Lrp/AsnC ligand binding domain-containing protein [Sessilibacter corallicola]
MNELDRIDRNIIRILQKEGRLTYAELSRRVGLSTTPCVERVKRLEKKGVIRGYTALIDPDFLKASLVVFIQFRLTREPKNIFEKFRDAAKALEEVQECYLVSGSFDYLIKARVQDMKAYRKFYGETLLTLPGVQECTSYVVMEEVKDTLEVPVNYGN